MQTDCVCNPQTCGWLMNVWVIYGWQVFILLILPQLKPILDLEMCKCKQFFLSNAISVIKLCFNYCWEDIAILSRCKLPPAAYFCNVATGHVSQIRRTTEVVKTEQEVAAKSQNRQLHPKPVQFDALRWCPRGCHRLDQRIKTGAKTIWTHAAFLSESTHKATPPAGMWKPVWSCIFQLR